MTELNQTMVKALVFTQGCLLSAMCATHPDPVALQRVFLDQVNQLVENLKSNGASQEFWGSIRLFADEALGHIPAAPG